MDAEHNKWLTQIKRGVIELCCLNLLASEELYGYELAKRLSSAPPFDVTLGTVYPLLSRMKRDGLVDGTLEASPHGPARRKYALSKAGMRRLELMNSEWGSISKFIDSLMPDFPDR